MNYAHTCLALDQQAPHFGQSWIIVESRPHWWQRTLQVGQLHWRRVPKVVSAKQIQTTILTSYHVYLVISQKKKNIRTRKYALFHAQMDGYIPSSRFLSHSVVSSRVLRAQFTPAKNWTKHVRFVTARKCSVCVHKLTITFWRWSNKT